MQKINRYVTIYDKVSRDAVMDFDLPEDLDLNTLRVLFCKIEEDPMHDWNPISLKESLYFKDKIEHVFDFDRYEYRLTNDSSKLYKLDRYITLFDKYSEDLKMEIPLPRGIDLRELQALFNEIKENPMYDCYRITPKEAPYFKNKIEHKFNFELYEYFLEASMGDLIPD